jgi:hypothetical protein
MVAPAMTSRASRLAAEIAWQRGVCAAGALLGAGVGGVKSTVCRRAGVEAEGPAEAPGAPAAAAGARRTSGGSTDRHGQHLDAARGEHHPERDGNRYAPHHSTVAPLAEA